MIWSLAVGIGIALVLMAIVGTAIVWILIGIANYREWRER